MKLKFVSVLALAVLYFSAGAQDTNSKPAGATAAAPSPKKAKAKFYVPGQKKPALFGIGFSLTDFNAPKNYGSNSNATTIPIKNMSAGFFISYWQGLTPMIDFSAKLNGVFHDFSAIYKGELGKTEIGLELEPTISIRPVKDENMIAPFFTAGWGIGLYTDRVGSYVPVGGGLQFNFSNTTYVFVQTQYKFSLTPKVLGDNMFYSIGFSQNIKGGD